MDRDKRDYYRLDDTILIEFRHITQGDAENAAASDFFTSDPNFHLLRDIYELQLESREMLRTLNQQSRQLGNFLANLDKRVEILARSVLLQGTDRDGLLDCQAEISEGGLSFLSESLIEVGQFLALRLLFQPSCLGLACFAEVRHCQLEQDEYRIGVRFSQSDYRTQRLISRHIISRQAEERRSRLQRGS
tara:strand:- start:47995 stop:48564 length:570 start_codon:yes stop_codon:yes gene_type:complete